VKRLNLQDLLKQEHEPVNPDKLLCNLQTRDAPTWLYLNGVQYFDFVVGTVPPHAAL